MPSRRTDETSAPWAASPQQARFLGNAPDQYKGSLEKVYRGEVSPRRAIKVMCLECCGWAREAARACEVTGCPLHQISRPLFGRGAE